MNPWWWAITTKELPSPKRIENRKMTVRGVDRPPAWSRYRGPILLHASARCSPNYYDDAVIWMLGRSLIQRSDGLPALSAMQSGGIIGRANIVTVIEPLPRLEGMSCYTPTMHKRWCDRVAPDVDYRWHMVDQWGFVLADVEPLQFHPCKGMLGLWEFDERLLSGATP